MFHNKKNSKKLVLNLSPKKQQPTVKVNTGNNTNIIEDHCYKIYYQYGPACILPNLYLGACYNAENIQQLHRLDVTSIINVASEINLSPPSNKLDYHHIRWTHNEDNLDFNQVIQIIYAAHKKDQVVLVHCQQGIERSATLVLAYLIYLSRCNKPFTALSSNLIAGQNWSLDHAISYVQKRAPAIRPNMNQLYQLREYEKSMPIQHKRCTRSRSGSVILCNNNKLPEVRRKRAASVRELTTKSLWDGYDNNATKKQSDEKQLTQSNTTATATATAVLLVACMAVYQKNYRINM